MLLKVIAISVALVFVLPSLVTSDGPCVFPFTYQDNNYTSCVFDNVTSKDICLTFSGAKRVCRDPPGPHSVNKQCHFPFVYRNTTYLNCVNSLSGQMWCCTDYHCSTNEWARCKDHPDGQLVSDQPCRFPFMYHGKQHWECVTQDHEGRPWCATTANYDQDMKWRDCVESSAVDFCKPKRMPHPSGQIYASFHNIKTFDKKHPYITCSFVIKSFKFQSIRIQFRFLDLDERCPMIGAKTVNSQLSTSGKDTYNNLEIHTSTPTSLELCRPNGTAMHSVLTNPTLSDDNNFVLLRLNLTNRDFRGFVLDYDVFGACSASSLLYHDYTFIDIVNSSYVQYSCSNGYKLRDERSKVLTCDENTGQWSAPPGECVVVTCPLPQVKNFTFVKHKSVKQFIYGDTVHFSCSNHRILEGNASMTCQADGTWSNSEPNCVLHITHNNSLAVGSLVAGMISVVIVCGCILFLIVVLTRTRIAHSLWERCIDSKGRHQPVNQRPHLANDTMQYRDIQDPNADIYEQTKRQNQQASYDAAGNNSTMLVDSDSEAELVDNEIAA